MLSAGVCNSALRGPYGPVVAVYLSSCFLDVVLVPLPSFLLLLPALYLVVSPSPALSPKTGHTTRATRALAGTYGALVCALFLMQLLVVVRLGLSHQGVGLLPLNLILILLILVLLHRRRQGSLSPGTVKFILQGYWCLFMIFQAIKVNSLRAVENVQKALGQLGPSQYLNSDNSLDNYVILGLLVVFLLYELVYPRLSKGVESQEQEK